MAVGGAPDLTDLETLEENLQAQADEIEVLQSIFEGEDNHLQILATAQEANDGNTQNMLKINVPVTYPDSLVVDVFLPMDEGMGLTNGASATSVQIARSESGRRVIWSFEVSHLPPVSVHASLSKYYPSSEPPSFAVSCIWMSPKQLTLVCQELDRLWLENGGDTEAAGMPILYTWHDWLHENILSVLGIVGQMSVSSHTLDDDVDDCRIVMETNNIEEIVTTMMRYNEEEELRIFGRSQQECSICFMENLGSKFFRLAECRHHMCRECLTSHCELLVKEGTVQNLRCPMYECKNNIPPYVLQEILQPEDFERYDSLSLQKALGSMGDVTWCPRCNSVVIIEPEEHLMLAHCTSCMYTFCTKCMEAWHQGELCKEDEELEAEAAEKKIRSQNDKEHAERKRKLREANRASKRYISEMAKVCKGCQAPIMKISGCNKVVCGNCGRSLCWVCMQTISGYDHFTNSKKCNTFEAFDYNDVDNTDIGDRYMQFGIQRPVPHQFVPRKVTSKGEEIRNQVQDNPDLAASVKYCLGCKQINLMENRSNHLRCWSCKLNSCCHCKTKIIGPVGRHFAGVGSCPQHAS